MALRFSKHFRDCHPVRDTAMPCGPLKKGQKSWEVLPPLEERRERGVRRCPGDQAEVGPLGVVRAPFPSIHLLVCFRKRRSEAARTTQVHAAKGLPRSALGGGGGGGG